MPAPTYNGTYTFSDGSTSGWGIQEITSNTVTSTFTVNSGDLIIVFSGTSDYDEDSSRFSIPSVSDNYNLRWEIVSVNAGTNQYCPLICWQAINTYQTSITLTVSINLSISVSSSVRFGGQAFSFSFADGIGFTFNSIGASVANNNSVSVTPFRGQSAMFYYLLDWESWSMPDRTFNTNNGFAPTELTYQDTGNNTVVGLLYQNVVDGTLTITTANVLKYTVMAVEIMGVASGVGSPGILPPIIAPGSPSVTNVSTITNISTLTI